MRPAGSPHESSAGRRLVESGIPASATKASQVSDNRPRFGEVSARVDLPALDARILAFWKARHIFEKSLEGREDAPVYVFYEGPPTANGRPGSHHVISRIFKDLFPRYKTMRGYRVPRKAGWDTHGLPVELEVERKLGINGKKQIEEYGIAEFNQLCKESVTAYLAEWELFTERIGFWVDLQDAYYTYTNDYIETVWWLLRQIWDKGLLYQGHKVVPYCPRCGTAISSHEVAQGYQDVTEDSVYLRFPLKPHAAGRLGIPEGEPASLAVWTTTPWTLLSNVAAAVRPDMTYVVAESRGERFVVARELVHKVLGKEAIVERELAGSDLLGLEYEPPFRYMTPDKRAHFVIAGDYVTTKDGTGIVHIAPAFGEDDMRVGRENDLPVVNAVDTEGRFIPEVAPWAGIFVKDADPAIIAELRERGLLIGVEPYEHSYPFCWRCDTPLLYYAKATWYVRTTAVKDELLKANDAVTWYPEHIKYGRFGEWLANNIDWALSRDRYWGTPLPIWRCDEGHAHCIGSVAELRAMAAGPVPEELELHRPYVDDVVLRCPECGGDMRRVHEVIDAWFDSGSMPFGQWHYPFENVETFKERFPADYICEAIDQTRGWFYSLIAVATLVEGYSSYKTVLCLGHILDADGQKMSKSRGNVVQPEEILDKQGADAFRWFMFATQNPWSPRRFSPEMVDEVVRKFLLTLWNTYSFFIVYANIDRFDPASQTVPLHERPLIDRWLISELNRLTKVVTDGLEDYDATGTARAIQEFVDDLSNWYVRRSRRRFWKSESDSDKLSAYHTLYEALVTVTKLLAPFTPFIAEELYQNLVRSVDESSPESVHLCPWPSVDEETIDSELSFSMAAARRVVELGRAARNAAAVKTRQPLAEVAVALPETERSAVEALRDVVLDELNVKDLRLVGDEGEMVAYTVKPNLKLLGPRLGKQLGPLQAALRELDGAAVVADVRSKGSLTVATGAGDITVSESELLIETGSPEGYQVESDAGRTVALKTAVDDALREEGVAREIVHAIQLARKNADLRIEETISLTLSLPGQLEALAGRHRETIKLETLASELTIGKVRGEHLEQARIDGQEIGIGLTPTGTIFTVTYG